MAPLLPTGSDTASAELAGFRKGELPGLHVSVDQKVRIELRLGALEREDVIEVQADTPLLQTSASDLGTTVEGALIASLPLNGRWQVSRLRGLMPRFRPDGRELFVYGPPSLVAVEVRTDRAPSWPARRSRSASRWPAWVGTGTS